MLSGISISILSALIIGGSALLVFILEKHRRASSLRVALRTEIEENSRVVSRISNDVMDFEEPAAENILNMIDTTIYDSSSGDLGLLTNQEAHAVIRYYSTLNDTISVIKFAIRSEGDSDVDLDEMCKDIEIMRDATTHLLERSTYKNLILFDKESITYDYDAIETTVTEAIEDELSEEGITPEEYEKRKTERSKMVIRDSDESGD